VDHPQGGQFRHALLPVAEISPEIARACGWYDGLLLTQFPEAYFGEPMLVLSHGDQVERAYPVGTTRILGEDGTLVDVVQGGLRVTTVDGTVERPRSQKLREFPVTFGAGLSGTVIVPATPGRHPAAVMVHGAAGGQRDFNRLFVKPLLDAGLAVLIYDKPGYGESAGSGHPTIFEQADAASAGLDVLASWPDVDPARVGLLGFSNGMWSVPMVAARRDVAFVAGLAGAGLPMADCEVHRRTKVLREAGVGAQTTAAAGEAWRCLFEIVGSGSTTDTVVRRLEQALDQLTEAADLAVYEPPDYVRQNPMVSPVPPLVPVAQLLAMMPTQAEPELLYDPAEDYAKFRCPVHLQYGSEDTSIPVAASVPRIEAALAQAGVPATIRIYDGVEHMLNVVPEGTTGLTTDAVVHGFHRFRFASGVWSDLTDWLRENS
jgi:dienelactone hydrolase